METAKGQADAKGSSTVVEKVVVARASDIPEGERLLVEVRGRKVVVFNVKGEFYAMQDRCPHKGGPLCSGDVIALVDSDRPGEWNLNEEHMHVSCPWHAWEFDLKTGQSYTDAERTGSRPFPAAVSDGATVEREIAAGSTAPAQGSMMVDAAKHRVKGPYQAEIFPVSTEEDYVVISLRRGKNS